MIGRIYKTKNLKGETIYHAVGQTFFGRVFRKEFKQGVDAYKFIKNKCPRINKIEIFEV